VYYVTAIKNTCPKCKAICFVQTAPLCHTNSKFKLRKLAEAEAEAAELLGRFALVPLPFPAEKDIHASSWELSA
jgi:hypothetical protein